MTDPATSEACVKAAFEALLAGNGAERDRLCERAEKILQAERWADAAQRVMEVDFYVNNAGVATSTKLMLQLQGIVQ